MSGLTWPSRRSTDSRMRALGSVPSGISSSHALSTVAKADERMTESKSYSEQRQGRWPYPAPTNWPCPIATRTRHGIPTSARSKYSSLNQRLALEKSHHMFVLTPCTRSPPSSPASRRSECRRLVVSTSSTSGSSFSLWMAGRPVGSREGRAQGGGEDAIWRGAQQAAHAVLRVQDMQSRHSALQA